MGRGLFIAVLLAAQVAAAARPPLPSLGSTGRTVMDPTSPLFGQRLRQLSRRRAALLRVTGGVARLPATSLKAALAAPGAFHYHDRGFVEATPDIPPLLRHQLRRLRGAKPFANHHLLFVGHGYSDAVPWVETFLEAGANPLKTTFLPTNYGFHGAVADQLTWRGVLVHNFAMGPQPQDAYEAVVEAHLDQVLRDAERAGEPVLIFDDGGVATRLLAEKFAQRAGRVTVVEQTDAGHRRTLERLQRDGRLPFTYWSMARDWVKREVTSPRFAGRVVDRVYTHLDVNNLALADRTAVVVGGGGAMGLPAAIRLRQDGFRVRIIEKDVRCANAQRARDAGFTDIVPLTDGRELAGHALILGMTGEAVVGPQHMRHVDDGAVFAQGSSKRREFDMAGMERELNKIESPFTGMPTSRQYWLGTKSFHFLLDGWTVNHANTFHGTPMRDLQLELATYFETALAAVRTPNASRTEIHELPLPRQKVLERLDRLTRDRIPESTTPPSVNPFDRIY